MLEYFVYGSLITLNHSIYHSSSYGEMTDKSWEELSLSLIQDGVNLVNAVTDKCETISNL